MNGEELHDLAGRVLVAGFEGTSLPDDLRGAIRRGALGGLVLFKRNVESAKQVRDLLGEARVDAPSGAAPLTCVDQEGGRVVRLRDPLTVLPPAARFGEVDDPAVTHAAGRLVGRELRAVGFTLDLAPVLDVNSNPHSPVIGDRAFAADSDGVIRHGLAFARGLRDGGVFPCAKHFPGHGDATVDSHLALPRVEHDRERLERVELAPFAAWARTGLGPVMSAHIVFPALDPDRPATASRRVLADELVSRLRHRGPVLTDDLEMGAIAEAGGAPELAVNAIRAGAHGLLVCRSAALRTEILDRLVREARSDGAFHERLVRARAQLATLAFPPGVDRDFAWLGSAEHRAEREALGAQLGMSL